MPSTPPATGPLRLALWYGKGGVGKSTTTLLLALLAADYVILPVELTADCRERVETALRILGEARARNPSLTVLGVLALASAPRSGRDKRLSAKERLIYDEYAEALAAADIRLFQT